MFFKGILISTLFYFLCLRLKIVYGSVYKTNKFEKISYNSLGNYYLKLEVIPKSNRKCAMICNQDLLCKSFQLKSKVLDYDDNDVGVCYLIKDILQPSEDSTAHTDLKTFVLIDSEENLSTKPEIYTENIIIGKNGCNSPYVARIMNGHYESAGGDCAVGMRETPFGWYGIDLGGEYIFTHGRVLPRRDGGATSHLQEFSIVASQNRFTAENLTTGGNLCFKQQSPYTAGAWIEFKCTIPTKGRHVAIYQPKQVYDMVVCELELFGKKISE